MNAARSLFKWILRFILLYVLFIVSFMIGSMVVLPFVHHRRSTATSASVLDGHSHSFSIHSTGCMGSG